MTPETVATIVSINAGSLICACWCLRRQAEWQNAELELKLKPTKNLSRSIARYRVTASPSHCLDLQSPARFHCIFLDEVLVVACGIASALVQPESGWTFHRDPQTKSYWNNDECFGKVLWHSRTYTDSLNANVYLAPTTNKQTFHSVGIVICPVAHRNVDLVWALHCSYSAAGTPRRAIPYSDQ